MSRFNLPDNVTGNEAVFDAAPDSPAFAAVCEYLPDEAEQLVADRLADNIGDIADLMAKLSDPRGHADADAELVCLRREAEAAVADELSERYLDIVREVA